MREFELYDLEQAIETLKNYQYNFSVDSVQLLIGENKFIIKINE